jgi:hypothetical protein
MTEYFRTTEYEYWQTAEETVMQFKDLIMHFSARLW